MHSADCTHPEPHDGQSESAHGHSCAAGDCTVSFTYWSQKK
jgi:hypothetical protein